jgi:hypothetical protein
MVIVAQYNSQGAMRSSSYQEWKVLAWNAKGRLGDNTKAVAEWQRLQEKR